MIKLYLDEDVHKKVATALRLKGYDAVSAHEVQKQSLTDHEQPAFASSQGRALFTFNSGDFNRLHSALTSKGGRHYGIMLAKQLPVGETVRRLAKFLFSIPPKRPKTMSIGFRSIGSGENQQKPYEFELKD